MIDFEIVFVLVLMQRASSFWHRVCRRLSGLFAECKEDVTDWLDQLVNGCSHLGENAFSFGVRAAA